jgi:CO/xanthine dehydrogenase FAD-binding subunit
MDGTQTKILPISDYLQERISSRSNELLCQLKVPLPDRRAGIAFASLALHPQEPPLMSVGVMLPRGHQNAFGPRIVIGGTASVPQRVPLLEDLVCRRFAPTEHEIKTSLEEISFEPDNGPAPDYLRRALTVLAGRTIRAASQGVSMSAL